MVEHVEKSLACPCLIVSPINLGTIGVILPLRFILLVEFSLHLLYLLLQIKQHRLFLGQHRINLIANLFVSLISSSKQLKETFHA